MHGAWNCYKKEFTSLFIEVGSRKKENEGEKREGKRGKKERKRK